MAAGHDANVHDDHDAPDAHGHGHDDHGDHGEQSDFWVVPPLLVGLVIGIIVVVVLGLGTGVPSFT